MVGTRSTKPKPDGDKSKRMPNGLKALFKRVRMSWRVSGPKERSISDFLASDVFGDVYRRIRAIYPTNKLEEPLSKSDIEKLESDGDSFLADLTYAKLRAYAEYTDVPVGWFILYAHLVSLEHQDQSTDRARRLLVVSQEAIKSLIELIDTSKARGSTKSGTFDAKGTTRGTGEIFYSQTKRSRGFFAELRGLESISKHFEGTGFGNTADDKRAP